MDGVRQFQFKHLTYALTIIVIAGLVLYPIGWLVRGSLIEGIDQPTFTLQWYVQAFTTSTLLNAIINTFIFAVGSTLVAMVFGVSIAWITSRTNVPLARPLELVSIVPFINIPYVGAVAWTLLAAPSIGFINKALRFLLVMDATKGPLNIYSTPGMIWVMGLYSAAYVFLFTSSALRRMDPAYEEVARISGKNIFQTTLTITLPLTAPAILSGALLSFVVAFGNFGIPSVLGVPKGISLLATEMYKLTNSFPPRMEQASALGMILLLVSIVGIWLHGRILRGKDYAIITGRNYKPARLDLGRWRWLAFAICLFYVLVAVVLPMLSLIYGSLINFWTTSFDPKIFTLDNFRYVLFDYKKTWTSIGNSFLLAFVAATTITILTVIAAYIVERTKSRLRGALNYLTILPLGIPGAALAVGMLMAYLRPPLILYGTIWILAIGYITHFTPFGMRSATSAIGQVHRELEESSTIAGASWLRTFRKITLPLILPSVVAGWTLLFIISVRELSTSVFLFSPGKEVIAVSIFELYDVGRNPRVAAFSVILVVFSLLVVGFVQKFISGDVAQGVAA